MLVLFFGKIRNKSTNKNSVTKKYCMVQYSTIMIASHLREWYENEISIEFKATNMKSYFNNWRELFQHEGVKLPYRSLYLLRKYRMALILLKRDVGYKDVIIPNISIRKKVFIM